MKGYLKSIPARVMLAVLGLFLSVNVYAQNVIIGTVVDETDEPLSAYLLSKRVPPKVLSPTSTVNSVSTSPTAQPSLFHM